MITIATDEVIDWLGPIKDDVTPDQVEAIRAGWESYYQSPPVRDREGEPQDWWEVDREATNAVAMVVLGDDPELATLGQQWRETRAVLYARAVGAIHAGMSEAAVAREAGIDRMTVRRLLGKQ